MNDVSERELCAALRPHRPDPETFRAGFERKLAERDEQREGRDEVSSLAWRSAAGVLPMGVFDPGIAGLAAPLGKSAGAKGLAAMLALPALALAMLGLTLVASLRRLVRLRTSSTASPEAVEVAARQWWTDHALHALIALALLLALGRFQPAEAVWFVLLISMLALTSMLLRLSRAGAASRESVAAFAANLLGALAALMLLFEVMSHGRWAGPWELFLLLSGSLVCDRIGNWHAPLTRRSKLLATLLPLFIMGAIGARLHARLRPLDRERLIAFVEDFDRPLTEVVEWGRLGTVTSWLLGHGEEALESHRARREVEGILSGLEGKASLLRAAAPAHALLGAARADLLPEQAWLALRADERGQGILALDGPLLESATTEWLVRASARIDLEEGERDRLAARLAAAWPDPDAPRALEAMAFYDRMSALLGRPHEGEPFRTNAWRALESHWLGRVESTGEVAPFVTDMDDRRRLSADIHRVKPTLAAVCLMRRHGVPPGVELDGVEAFLLRAATPTTIEALSPDALGALSVQSYRLVAEVALRELHVLRDEAVGPEPAPGALRRLLDGRQFLGALSLLGVCVFATLRAAAHDRERLKKGIS